jgi:hypothetical protein
MSWNQLGGFTINPHASASGIVAACLEIQVRIVHLCVSTIKKMPNYYLNKYSHIDQLQVGWPSAITLRKTHIFELLQELVSSTDSHMAPEKWQWRYNITRAMAHDIAHARQYFGSNTGTYVTIHVVPYICHRRYRKGYITYQTIN